MLNGALQMLQGGRVPGNRNGEDIDDALRPFTHLAYISAPLELGPGGVRSVLLKSFGFGQAGGELLLLHPDYLLASLEGGARERYAARRGLRERAAARTAQQVLTGARALVHVKAAPPYEKSLEQNVYLNPLARARWCPAAGSWRFFKEDLVPTGQGAGASSDALVVGADASGGAGGGGASTPRRFPLSPGSRGASPAASPLQQAPSSPDAVSAAVLRAAEEALSSSAAAGGASGGFAPAGRAVGVDIEPVATFSPAPAEAFAERNFTAAERSYCASSPNPPASWAGRWAAKEACVKALCSGAQGAGGAGALAALAAALKGGGGALRDIEVLPSEVAVGEGGRLLPGAPGVILHGAAARLADALGVPAIGGVKLSISHAGAYAVAVAAL
jgi:phosphopantetheine--protein transferase-like protein